MTKWLAKYKKLWVALGAVALAVLVALIDPSSANGVLIDDGISTAEWLVIVPMIAGAVVVGVSPNIPGASQAKSLCYLVVGLAAVLPSAQILDGITMSEGMMLGAYVLGYLGVRSRRVANVGDLYDRTINRPLRPPTPYPR